MDVAPGPENLSPSPPVQSRQASAISYKFDQSKDLNEPCAVEEVNVETVELDSSTELKGLQHNVMGVLLLPCQWMLKLGSLINFR